MATSIVHGPVSANSPTPALLEGASACHRMMAEIEALDVIEVPHDPSIEGDDGKRRDYARADQAVSAALDAFADNPGFRMALSNYLLMVNHDGRPFMAAWSAEAMLTDGGHRPMSAEVPENTPRRGVDLTPEKVDATLSATWEIEALCESGRDLAAKLGAMDDAAASRAELKLRGLFARLEQLNSALMSALDDDIDTESLQRKVFGRVREQGVRHA